MVNNLFTVTFPKHGSATVVATSKKEAHDKALNHVREVYGLGPQWFCIGTIAPVKATVGMSERDLPKPVA